MIVTRQLEKYTWVDLDSPTREDVDTVSAAHNIDHVIARDLLSPTPKQYMEGRNGSDYIVMHIPMLGHHRSESMEQEIDFVITENKLVTARYDSVEAIHYFAKKFEADEILNKTENPHPFFGIIKEIYKFLFDELSYIEGELDQIEKSIFEGKEREMVAVISSSSRSMLVFRRTLLEHKHIWAGLSETEIEYGDNFQKNLGQVVEEWQRLMAEAENISAMIVEIRETNNAMLSTKQNEIMKNLTVLAFIVIPLATISQIFGMNTVNNPIIGLEFDFWIIMGIMLFMTLATFIFFRIKKWL